MSEAVILDPHSVRQAPCAHQLTDDQASASSAAVDPNPNAQTEAGPRSEPVKKVPPAAKGIQLVEREPWPEPVDGALLLDALRYAFGRHLALPEGTAEAIALWVLLAHSHDAHQTSPRLAFVSPVPECGKTTALSILGALVPRALPTSNITPAVIFRVIEQRRPTLLIDEADSFLHASEDMRGILNSGHTRATATVWRCDGDQREPKGFSTWTPVVIAKIGKLPPTLESRSIEIAMRRRRPEESIEPVRPEDTAALWDLRSKAARWVADNFEALRGSEPDVPNCLYNRARDNWRPLLAIADVADGHWPDTARRVAVELCGGDEDPSLGIQLLSDIREIFRSERRSSDDLCADLRSLEDRPWTEDSIAINPRQLARLLKPFGIAPKSIRLGPCSTPNGYTAAQFEDAFARYLPPIPPSAATPPQA